MSGRSVLIAILLTASSAGWAGTNNAVFLAVPTLDEVGIGVLIAMVAGVAGWSVRRRERK